jgi:putative DNA primase/helicase
MGLSLRECLHALRLRYRIHITFSAQNMVKVAAKCGPGYVMADNDESGTGERVAKQIGMPHWISDTVGEDFNDFHRRVRLLGASQALRKFLTQAR